MRRPCRAGRAAVPCSSVIEFSGRLAVVTGSAHGIGEAVARRLADCGAHVVAVDRDGPALEEAFADGRVATHVADLGAGSPQELAASILDRFGPVQILVNNVGIDTEHSFLGLSEDCFDLVFRTNLRGPWFFTRALVSNMVERDAGGSILFVSSLHDHIVRRLPHYSTSKAAVAMLVQELAYELGPHGIRVNAVSPGVIRTQRVQEPSSEEAERLQHLIRLGGRPGAPEDVAQIAAMLLSDEWSGYVTGANVPVDGGLGLHTWSLPPADAG
jgi:3-oxoacyl-[acyl-carrier protein] reductase